MKADDSAMEKKDGGAMMEDPKMEGEKMMPKEEAMMKEETSMQKGETMMAKGSYEPYASAKLSMADAGDVVLFFRASWCPTCRGVDADIRAKKDAIPGGLTILDVDYDNSADLKKKYGVTYQHTFVQVDSKGNLIKKWAGSPTLAAIVAEVQ
jgi:thiol-disulfide isomerase/thioredoxin